MSQPPKRSRLSLSSNLHCHEPLSPKEKAEVKGNVNQKPSQIRKSGFTQSEDERIIQYVKGFGGSCTPVQWLLLDEELGHHYSAQRRWKNVLKPRVRTTLFSGPTLSHQNGALLASDQFKRKSYTALEDESILRFARERFEASSPLPWCRMDEELGRSGGAAIHRYKTLLAREAKKITAAQDHNMVELSSPLVDYSRVSNYTAEEDALITAAIHASPSTTAAQWKALAVQMNRPVSWLRYRSAILARKEGQMRAVGGAITTALPSSPSQGGADAAEAQHSSLEILGPTFETRHGTFPGNTCATPCSSDQPYGATQPGGIPLLATVRATILCNDDLSGCGHNNDVVGSAREMPVTGTHSIRIEHDLGAITSSTTESAPDTGSSRETASTFNHWYQSSFVF